MFLSIYNNQTGDEYIKRLGPNASLDLRHYVKQWVERETERQGTPSFSEPGSHIPNGCADYQAELRCTKASGATCWTSEPFYIDWTEDKA